MTITWIPHSDDPSTIHACDEWGVVLGYIRPCAGGWYAKHGTVTRIVRTFSIPEAKAALIHMIMHPEEAP